MTIYFRFYLCKNKLMKVFIGIEISFGFSHIDIKKRLEMRHQSYSVLYPLIT